MADKDKNPFSGSPDETDLIWDAMEALPEGIAIFGTDRRLITCNQRCMDMFPKVSDLIVPGVLWRDLLMAGAERGQFAEAAADPEDWIEHRLNDEFPLNRTLEIELASGTICQLQFSVTKRGGFVVVCTDITERKHTEAMVREQENLLRTVLETSPMAVVMARLQDARILYRSPAAVRFFGETENALQHYVNPKDREDYVETLSRDGRVDDYRIMLRDAHGKHCTTTSWGRLVDFEGDTYVVTAIMDLTEQQEREAMIRQVLEACPTPIQMTKADTGEVLFSSPETVALFGRVDCAKHFYATPGKREEYLEQLRRDGSVTEYKGQYLNADNKPFWAAVSARLIRYNGEEVIVSHTRDLTEQLRIEAELARQRDHLYQNEKLSAMGELLAGVAHELNNPLSVVVGHSLMLREDCKDPDLLRQVEKISNAAERCARIVKTFLTMARQQPARMQKVDINEIVDTAVDVVRYGDASDVNITCQLGAEVTRICADADQITQVVINLILNAEQAMRATGAGQNITVSTQQSKTDSGVEIVVEDDGPGIPPNIRHRVFEPFFTTKEVGDGTGIGLVLCHRIIQAHEGRISVAPGRHGGLVFRIFLPQDREIPDAPQDSQASDPVSNPLRILILDDEEDVADLNAEILTRGGYQVDVFNHAEEALESMRHHTYGLILSDLNMPETDGRGFFETIKQKFPDMISKTGFVTGDSMGRASQSFLGEANRPCIEKPVSPKELRAFVADILTKAQQVTE